MEIKCLVKKNNKFIVETEDKELAQYLAKKLLETKGDGVEVEWVFSYESPLVKPLMSKQWVSWVFGCCVKQIGLIHIFLDNVLKAYNVSGSEPIEEWFSNECSKHLIHELIHYYEPEWSESQVERASEHLIEACENIPKATKLTVHIGDREFIHLLTEDNQVLEVKST
ncbi:MAG: hypothetical protein QMD43_09925 [Thermodesulfovibrio sp.]|nr:hypothetical protein [Thermodesulfovibrio sp.]